MGSKIKNLLPLASFLVIRWDFTQMGLPDIGNSDRNVLVSNCRLHNDATVSISRDGRLMACFVNSDQSHYEDMLLSVISLETQTLGQQLYTKLFRE